MVLVFSTGQDQVTISKTSMNAMWHVWCFFVTYSTMIRVILPCDLKVRLKKVKFWNSNFWIKNMFLVQFCLIIPIMYLVWVYVIYYIKAIEILDTIPFPSFCTDWGIDLWNWNLICRLSIGVYRVCYTIFLTISKIPIFRTIFPSVFF